MLRTPLDRVLALLILMIPVSLWTTLDIRLTLPKVVGLLLGVSVFYLSIAYVDGMNRLAQLLVVYLSLGAAIAALALVGTNWLYKNPWLAAIATRLPLWIHGLPGAPEGFHPNEVAGVLLWFVPLQWVLLAWLWKQGRWKTWAASALSCSAALTTFTLLLTQSRSGLLGLALGLALMCSWLDRRVRTAMLLLPIGALILVGVRGPTRLQTTLGQAIASGLLGQVSWTHRLSIWRVGMWGIQDFPVAGMGLGTFRRVARVLYDVGIPPPSFDIGHAHNGFLQAALDLGIPGLLAYTGMWLVSARMTLASLQRSKGWMRALALGFWGCLGSSFAYNLTDTVALGAIGGLPWWMLLGLIVSVFRLVNSSTAVNRTSPAGEPHLPSAS